MTEEYQSLVESFSELTSRSARFRRVGLHTHTPCSHDFGECDCDKSLNDKSQYLCKNGEYAFLNHLIGNFEVIGITDHMRVGYGCRLANAAKEKGGVLILPGVELNLRLAPPLHEMRLHVIALFSEEKTVGEIERIFPATFKDDENRVGTEEICIGPDGDFSDLANFVEHIKANKGICIAAHVDNKQGVRYLFRQVGRDVLELFSFDGEIGKDQERELSEKFRDFLISANFHGIEVKRPSDRKHYSWISKVNGKRIEVPVFLTFDAHRVEDLGDVSRATYVKMADLSWRSLYEAIKFPDTRIRFSDDRVPPPHLVGIEIVSPTDKGFFQHLKVGFTNNLTCIIGPRGSGKSTIIDAIRYVFGFNRTLRELENEDLEKSVVNRQKVTLSECMIRVLYRLPNESIHVLEATFDHRSNYVTKVFDISGNILPVDDVERSGFYPLRLFGWSEIETLGRDSARQLDLLDKLIEDLSAVKEEKNQLKFKLTENRQRISQTITKLNEISNRNDKEVRKYQEYKREFDELNTTEIQQLFEDLDKNREYVRFVSNLGRIAGTTSTQITEIQTSELDEIIKEGEESNELSAWWANASSLLSIKDTVDQVKSHLDSAVNLLDTLQQRITSLQESIGNEIQTIETEIRGKVSADPSKQVLTDLRNQAKNRLERTETLRDEYQEEYENFERLFTDRSEILINLLRVHKKISLMRRREKNEIEERLNEFQTEDMRISLDFTRDGNRTELEQFLSDFECLQEAQRTYRAKKWPELIADVRTPLEVSQAILRERPLQLVNEKELDGRVFQIDIQDAERIVSKANPIGFDELAEIKTVDWSKLESLLKLQEVDWDDAERILRNDQPVDCSSPGQRSSAMLPLIALAESVPLIIDQPEDNLDNRLVGKVLVEILAKLKEKRQIIVSTHNPNIVVLGDAEQVVVLDAINDKRGQVERQASIDDPDIIKSVIELMEGGKEAFDTRNKRYQEQ